MVERGPQAGEQNCTAGVLEQETIFLVQGSEQGSEGEAGKTHHWVGRKGRPTGTADYTSPHGRPLPGPTFLLRPLQMLR